MLSELVKARTCFSDSSPELPAFHAHLNVLTGQYLGSISSGYNDCKLRWQLVSKLVEGINLCLDVGVPEACAAHLADILSSFDLSSTAMKPVPSTFTPSSLPSITSIRDGWECDCDHCSSVKIFLQDELAEVKILPSLGRPRAHIEANLQKHLPCQVTWTLVRTTTPMGLKGYKVCAPTAMEINDTI
ncbi:hypothetical protein BD413DRAFT_610380 [Trametes elegans]|nr:hypothetical protein BD413DRAFT_610380 [Trametes elegans]